MICLCCWLCWMLVVFLVLVLIGVVVVGGFYYVVFFKFFDVQILCDIEFQEFMYVYVSDGKLMVVFGEICCCFVEMKDVLLCLKQVFLVIEDVCFYEYGGVDYKGIVCVVWLLVIINDKCVFGGFIIIQQVVCQFFFSLEYSYICKILEILLVCKIEQELSKDEIFELYLNKSFFGNCVYGVVVVVEFYYGKMLVELDLDEMVLLVGIFKFFFSGNLLSNFECVCECCDYYVLQCMVMLGFIIQVEVDVVKVVLMYVSVYELLVQVEVFYVVELVCQEMIVCFGGDVVNKGYYVIIMINFDLQIVVNILVCDGLFVYDYCYGWCVLEKYIEFGVGDDVVVLVEYVCRILVQLVLLLVIVVSMVVDGSVMVVLVNCCEIVLLVLVVKWIGKVLVKLVQCGDIVCVWFGVKDGEWLLDQVFCGQFVLVLLDVESGVLKVLVGGFSFFGNSFNCVIQVCCQFGFSFKFFIYVVVFDKGFNLVLIVFDVLVVFCDCCGKIWLLQNDGGGFCGLMCLCEVLVQLCNLVLVCLFDGMGVDYVCKYISEFGFVEVELLLNLLMLLGIVLLILLLVVCGYVVFVNGGLCVDIWLIDQVIDCDGNVVFKENFVLVCCDCVGISGGVLVSQIVDGFNFGVVLVLNVVLVKLQQVVVEVLCLVNLDVKVVLCVIDVWIVYQLVLMMCDVVQCGIGMVVKVLGWEDVGGKIGFINDYCDVWFFGFGGLYVIIVWVGCDDFCLLGYCEYGGCVVLLIWIEYMCVVLKDILIVQNELLFGMVQVMFNGVIEWVKVEDMDKIEEYSFDIYVLQVDDVVFDIF